ncbi:MAG: PqqD family protein [Gammaproteobacteria bacterium]|nr:PqqD family protein [Gammaproteobacteria bacterium]
MLNAEIRLSTNEEQVAAKVMDGDAILINLSNGLYYRMGGAGGWIWSLIENQHSVGEITEILSKHFALAADDVLPDIQRMASELLGEELIRTIDARTAASEGAPSTSDLPASYEPPILEKYSDMADMFALDPPLPGLANVSAQKLPDRSEG